MIRSDWFEIGVDIHRSCNKKAVFVLAVATKVISFICVKNYVFV